MPTLGTYALKSRAACQGERGLSATAVRNSRQLSLNQRLAHHVEVKYLYWEDTRPRRQHKAAHHQHSMLRQHICRAAANVSLHTTLLGVGGIIHSPYTLELLKNLGLNKSSESHKACCGSSCSFGSIYMLIIIFQCLR